jgi:hypothetical protein
MTEVKSPIADEIVAVLRRHQNCDRDEVLTALINIAAMTIVAGNDTRQDAETVADEVGGFLGVIVRNFWSTMKAPRATHQWGGAHE